MVHGGSVMMLPTLLQTAPGVMLAAARVQLRPSQVAIHVALYVYVLYACNHARHDANIHETRALDTPLYDLPMWLDALLWAAVCAQLALGYSALVCYALVVDAPVCPPRAMRYFVYVNRALLALWVCFFMQVYAYVPAACIVVCLVGATLAECALYVYARTMLARLASTATSTDTATGTGADAGRRRHVWWRHTAGAAMYVALMFYIALATYEMMIISQELRADELTGAVGSSGVAAATAAASGAVA